jgi:hypothetical protein
MQELVPACAIVENEGNEKVKEGCTGCSRDHRSLVAMKNVEWFCGFVVKMVCDGW